MEEEAPIRYTNYGIFQYGGAGGSVGSTGEGTNGAGGQWNSSTLNARRGSGSIKTSASPRGGGGAGVMLAYYGPNRFSRARH